MTTRNYISKKTRFEVFKRDSFTCQYCGRNAPDIILEIDHIKPHSECQDDSIINLITACFDCNRGKGKRKLSNNQLITSQKNELDKLRKRREQMEFMIKDKSELLSVRDKETSSLLELIKTSIDCGLSETGKQNLLKSLRHYGYKKVYEAIEKSVDQYFDIAKEDSKESVLVMYPKILKTEELSKTDPFLKDINYINKILSSNFTRYYPSEAKTLIRKALKIGIDFNDLKYLAQKSRYYIDFEEEVCDLIGKK